MTPVTDLEAAKHQTSSSGRIPCGQPEYEQAEFNALERSVDRLAEEQALSRRMTETRRAR